MDIHTWSSRLYSIWPVILPGMPTLPNQKYDTSTWKSVQNKKYMFNILSCQSPLHFLLHAEYRIDLKFLTEI